MPIGIVSSLAAPPPTPPDIRVTYPAVRLIRTDGQDLAATVRVTENSSLAGLFEASKGTIEPWLN